MASGHLLDTDILSAAMRGEPHALFNRLAGISADAQHLPALVLGELAVGAKLGMREAATLAAARDQTAGMRPSPLQLR